MVGDQSVLSGDSPPELPGSQYSGSLQRHLEDLESRGFITRPDGSGPRRRLRPPASFRPELIVLAITLLTIGGSLAWRSDAATVVAERRERRVAVAPVSSADAGLEPTRPLEAGDDLYGVDPTDPSFASVRRLLLRALGTGSGRRDDVARGRFRADFDRGAELLAVLDLESIRTVRRGPDWVLLEGPIDLELANRRSFEVRPGDRRVRVRLDCWNGAWRIESVVTMRIEE